MFIVFSDFDGTLMDHNTYSMSESMEGINILKQKKIPLVLCSSKTDPEMREIHDELDLDTPYIFENGAGIRYPGDRTRGEEGSIEIIGRDINGLKECLVLLRKAVNREIKLMIDMDTAEIADLTGLSRERAELAKQRTGSIPFIITENYDMAPDELDRLNGLLKPEDLVVARGGRFFHFSSIEANKGRAVTRVVDFYKLKNIESNVTSIGIGDSPNDIPMFDVVDIPFLVKRPDGTVIDTGMERIRITARVGPAGFTEAVKSVLKS